LKRRSERDGNTARWLYIGGAKKFRPAADPSAGAQDGQNLISRSLNQPLPTDPVWWGSVAAISSYRGNRPTHTQTNTPAHAHRQDRLEYTAPQLR